MKKWSTHISHLRHDRVSEISPKVIDPTIRYDHKRSARALIHRINSALSVMRDMAIDRRTYQRYCDSVMKTEAAGEFVTITIIAPIDYYPDYDKAGVPVPRPRDLVFI